MLEMGLSIVWHAARALARARWITAGVVVIFALGIGLNYALFALVDRLLFRPLPYEKPEQLFLLQEIDRDTGQPKSSLPQRYVTEARRRLAFLEGMATAGDTGSYYVTPDLDGPELRLSNVTYQMTAITGRPPVLGRGFTAEDDQRKRAVVMLTYEGWQERFGGSPDVLGRKLWLRDDAYEIIGVLPRGFILPGPFLDPTMMGMR